MLTEQPNEDLMRRFLLDDVTDEERVGIETQFAEDPKYLEALCALEDDLMLSHLRGELPEELRERFQAAVLESPVRRKRVEELAAFVAALPTSRPASSMAPARAKGPGWFVFRWELGLATVVVAAIGAVLVVRQAPPPVAETARTEERGELALRGKARAVTLTLLPDLPRAELGQINVFRIPGGTERIELAFMLSPESAAAFASVEAVLRPVGGEPIPMREAPVLERTTAGVQVMWSVPAGALPPGDYLLIATGVRDQVRQPLPSYFFSIVE